MEYTTVLDIAGGGYQGWGILVFGSFFIIMGLIRIAAHIMSDFVSESSYAPYWFTLLAIAITAGAFWGDYSEYRCIKQAIIDGKYEIVEGTISELSHAGEQTEKIVVSGHAYEFHSFWAKPIGPLGKEVHVRITDVNGVVARLEIAQDKK